MLSELKKVMIDYCCRSKTPSEDGRGSPGSTGEDEKLKLLTQNRAKMPTTKKTRLKFSPHRVSKPPETN